MNVPQVGSLSAERPPDGATEVADEGGEQEPLETNPKLGRFGGIRAARARHERCKMNRKKREQMKECVLADLHEGCKPKGAARGGDGIRSNLEFGRWRDEANSSSNIHRVTCESSGCRALARETHGSES